MTNLEQMYRSTLPAYDPNKWKVEDPVVEPLQVKPSGLNRDICEDEHFEDKVIRDATYEP